MNPPITHRCHRRRGAAEVKSPLRIGFTTNFGANASAGGIDEVTIVADCARLDLNGAESMAARQLHFLWDYDIDAECFVEILEGKRTVGRLDRDWAALRLLEYGSYRDIVELLGFAALLKGWPRWRERVRSEQLRRGLDFLAAWLPEHRPDLCG